MKRRTPEQSIARLQQQLARARERNRKQDAHRKIVLGGVVIAAGADSLDPAELCGWLVTLMEKRTTQSATQMRERGISQMRSRTSAADPISSGSAID